MIVSADLADVFFNVFHETVTNIIKIIKKIMQHDKTFYKKLTKIFSKKNMFSKELFS